MDLILLLIFEALAKVSRSKFYFGIYVDGFHFGHKLDV
ncbi:hypothetical protein LEP1GSC198_1860 [Leptospira kirschneri str. JB]|nr:hypothetical protein LEP1GSC198_1860 [Leptospira kirschneri str. JB]